MGKLRGYPLGRAREHSFMNMTRRHGWFAVRMTGSAGGSPGMKVRPIDVICIRKIPWGETIKNFMIDRLIPFDWAHVRLVQLSKRKSDITKDEIDELLRLANIMGAEAILSYKNKTRFESIRADTQEKVMWQ